MTPFVHRFALAFLGCATLCLATVAGQAQSKGTPVQSRLMDSRAALQASLKTADSLKLGDEAAAIRARLQNGDFREGDRILFIIQSVNYLQPAADTLTVLPGRIVSFQNRTNVPIPDLSLAGVLRSEVTAKIRAHFATVLRDSFTVVTSPMVRLGAHGHVAQANYYLVPVDARMSDIIRIAGGLAADANPDKITIKRGQTLVMGEAEVRAAFGTGITIDQMNLREEDVITVAKKSDRSLLTWIQISAGLVGLIFALTR